PLRRGPSPQTGRSGVNALDSLDGERTHLGGLMKGRAWTVVAALAVASLTAITVLGLGTAQTASGRTLVNTTPTTGCQLASAKGKIKHVIYIQFDNTHLRRDNPNVPSDLEQMPHLLNFINGNG